MLQNIILGLDRSELKIAGYLHTIVAIFVETNMLIHC